MTAATTTGAVGASSDAQPCPVCEHDLRAHSAISARFCRATASQGLSDNRHCICSTTTSVASY